MKSTSSGDFSFAETNQPAASIVAEVHDFPTAYLAADGCLVAIAAFHDGLVLESAESAHESVANTGLPCSASGFAGWLAVLRESAEVGRESSPHLSQKWVLASDDALSTCGVVACSAHAAAFMLADKILKAAMGGQSRESLSGESLALAYFRVRDLITSLSSEDLALLRSRVERERILLGHYTTSRRPSPVDLPQAAIEKIAVAVVGKLACEMPKKPDTKTPKAKAGAVEKRSWIQRDLDNAIRNYKAERASHYNQLAQRVKEGAKGAVKAAQKMFGRNALVKALGVKSPAMVSKSPAWHEIAADLGLRCKANGTYRGPARQRIGYELAQEEAAQAKGDTVADDVERNEVIEWINTRRDLSQELKDATIEKLYRGTMTPDGARELVAELSKPRR